MLRGSGGGAPGSEAVSAAVAPRRRRTRRALRRSPSRRDGSADRGSPCSRSRDPSSSVWLASSSRPQPAEEPGLRSATSSAPSRAGPPPTRAEHRKPGRSAGWPARSIRRTQRRAARGAAIAACVQYRLRRDPHKPTSSRPRLGNESCRAPSGARSRHACGREDRARLSRRFFSSRGARRATAVPARGHQASFRRGHSACAIGRLNA